MKSKKTTIAGILAFVSLAAAQIAFLFDADPGTNPDYQILGAAFFTLLMGIFARDNDITSEKAGAK